MHVVVTRRKAATLFVAAAVIVLCVGAVLVVPSSISKKNRINKNIGEDKHHSSFQTASDITQEGSIPETFNLFQQEHSIKDGSISDRPLATESNTISAPAPSMSMYAAPTLAPTIAPNLGSDYPSIVPAKWGTVAPTAGWQQLVPEKGRHHAIKVKRQRHLRESYHQELKKRRFMASSNKNNN
jgi:hypothetical protein